MRAKILIVDDDPDILLSLQNRVGFMGHEPLTSTNGKDALRVIHEEEPDLVLLDLELPLLSGLDVLKQVRETSVRYDSSDQDKPQSATTYTTPLIVMLTAYGTIERAVQAMQLGAFDFVPKPFTSDHLTVVIKKALDTVTLYRQVATLRKEVEVQFEPAVTTNKRMSAELAIAKQAASSPVTVLLLGETGTGKEVVARAIHRWSPRAAKPFVAVNCAAFPESLLENELFGHEKGAFTGAAKRDPGRSKRPKAERCSSTKSAICHSPCKAISCGCSTIERSIESVEHKKYGPTCDSSPPPTEISTRRFVKARSARISIFDLP
jgi:DNA-binding NtrC family response regulator